MLALIDRRASTKLLSSLQKRGFETVLMSQSPSLQMGVASHTDMLLFIGFGRLFCHLSYYEDNRELIDKIIQKGNLTLSLSNETWSPDYPFDVLFNACLIGNRLICNEKTVSHNILTAAKEFGCEIVNVRQGYTKCSICTVSDNAIITADKSIADKCTSAGIEVLLVSDGHVNLPPYDHGFIGGATGLHGENVFFCGSTNTHPNGERIMDFCKTHGRNVVCLSDDELEDVGSIFFIG